jgi:hypothetical protein
MKKTLLFILAVIAIVIVGLVVLRPSSDTTVNITPSNSTSTVSTSSTSTASSSQSSAGQTLTLAGGEISLEYPAQNFALATDASQVTVHAYIPPCDESFDYCFFYTGSTYTGTNFESAGLRIKLRSDITSERLCLNTPPAGFDSSTLPTKTTSTSLYSASMFTNVGDAGAGHSANGSLYRIFVRAKASCYEFQTRIGVTQFANYPAGSIREFTQNDRETLESSLQSILGTLRLSSSGTAIVLPR